MSGPSWPGARVDWRAGRARLLTAWGGEEALVLAAVEAVLAEAPPSAWVDAEAIRVEGAEVVIPLTDEILGRVVEVRRVALPLRRAS